MNRRSFITSILTLAAAPSILPAALTYQRQWKIEKSKYIYTPHMWSPDQCLQYHDVIWNIIYKRPFKLPDFPQPNPDYIPAV